MENPTDITGLFVAVCSIPCLIIIMVLTIGPIAIIVESRKGKLVELSPLHTLTIDSNLSAPRAFSAILDSVQRRKYKIDDVDEDKHQVVLNESISLFSWGFFYLVSVHQDANGDKSKIEVGIQSKLIQVGPIVHRHHKKFVDMIKSSLEGNENLSE